MSKLRAESMNVRMWHGMTPSNMLTVPSWILTLADRISVESEITRPRLAYLQPKEASTYGGRYFPKEHAIGIFHYKARAIVRVVLIHEMAHALLGAEGHNGSHDGTWERVARALYRRYHAEPGAIALVDG